LPVTPLRRKGIIRHLDNPGRLTRVVSGSERRIER
jgi:hypothetical protein